MCAQKKKKKKGNKQEDPVDQEKLFNKGNIVLMIIAAVCIAVYLLVSNWGSLQKGNYKKHLYALEELTTTEEILKAINAAEEKQYLINNYEFPFYTTVGDPQGHVSGEYIYISVLTYHEGNDGKSHHDQRYDKESCGRLFFDNDTELLGVKNAITVASENRRNITRGSEEYSYSYIKPGAKFSFVALLGNHTARVSGFGNDCRMVQGDKNALVTRSSEGYSLLKFFLGLGAALCIFVLVCDRLSISKKKKKALLKEQKKQQEEEEWKQTLAWQDQQLELARKQREAEEKGNANQ